MNFIKRKLSYLIVLFKDKMKMQHRINTLEVNYESLEELYKKEFQEVIDKLMNKEEMARLKKENSNLRRKIKVLRGNKK